MALIECKECGKEVSSFAKHCPNCGYPIAEINSVIPEETEQEFPQLPTVMNVGTQVEPEPFHTTIVTDAYFLHELNYTKYLKDGKVTLHVMTRGIEIEQPESEFATRNNLFISYDQIINMTYLEHEHFMNGENFDVKKAIVGKLLLGNMGMVLGGLKGLEKKKIANYCLVINFYDVYTRDIQTLLILTKEHPLSFINECKAQQDMKNPPKGTYGSCNLLDDNNNLDEKKVIEAIPLVDRDTLIREITLAMHVTHYDALMTFKKIREAYNIDINTISPDASSKSEWSTIHTLIMILVIIYIIVIIILLSQLF